LASGGWAQPENQCRTIINQLKSNAVGQIEFILSCSVRGFRTLHAGQRFSWHERAWWDSSSDRFDSNAATKAPMDTHLLCKCPCPAAIKRFFRVPLERLGFDLREYPAFGIAFFRPSLQNYILPHLPSQEGLNRVPNRRNPGASPCIHRRVVNPDCRSYGNRSVSTFIVGHPDVLHCPAV